MLELYKSQRFQQEYTDYRNQISVISVPDVCQRAENLLAKLVGEVKFLDKQHEEMVVTNKLPMRLTESKSKIKEIRKELDILLKDFNSIKPYSK